MYRRKIIQVSLRLDHEFKLVHLHLASEYKIISKTTKIMLKKHRILNLNLRV